MTCVLTAEELHRFQKWLDDLNSGVQSIRYSDPFPGMYRGHVILVDEMGEVANVFYKHHVGGVFT